MSYPFDYIMGTPPASNGKLMLFLLADHGIETGLLFALFLIGAAATVFSKMVFVERSTPLMRAQEQRLDRVSYVVAAIGWLLYVSIPTTTPFVERLWFGLFWGLLLSLLLQLPITIAFFLYLHIFSPLAAVIRRSRERAKERREVYEKSKRSLAESERNRNWEAQQAAERAEVEAQQEREKAVEERIQAGDQRRRDDARAQCEVAFSTIAPDIAARFTRREFDAFMTKFMGDNRGPDEVESRRDQLLKILETHEVVERPRPKFKTLEELATWYAKEKENVGKLPIDEESREDQIIRLNTLFAELSEKVMQEQYR